MQRDEIKGKTAQELKIGDKESMSKTVTEYDIHAFAGVTGDFNPAHINEEYAKESIFHTRIAHGMLGAGFISAVLGTKLPGPGSIYLKQETEFKRPVKIGDTITAIVEVEHIENKGKYYLVRLKTTCYNQKDEIVIDGYANIIPPN